MTTARAHTKIGIRCACVLLFILFFPVLHLLTHPCSVLYGTDYTPLILRLDDFYWGTGLMSISLFSTPLLLVALILLIRRQRFSFFRALIFLLTPFLLALGIQYFIAVQLDQYLRFPLMGQPVPWECVFQSGFILYCLQLTVGYAGTCAVLVAALVVEKPTGHGTGLPYCSLRR